MPILLPPLPYKTNSLEPHISEKTVLFHYNKHHTGYLNNLNELIEGTEYQKMSLTEIVKKSSTVPADTSIFNNAAQVYNHNMFWASISPKEEDRRPSENLLMLINKHLNSFQDCVSNLTKLSIGRFGSGWAWLCFDPKNKSLQLTSTQNAGTLALE